MELRPPARGREDAPPPARGAPRRRVAAVAGRGRRDARARRGDRRRTFSARWSTSRSSRSRFRRRRRVTTCSTPSATTRSSALPRAAVSTLLDAPTPSTSRPLADEAWPGSAGRDWLQWVNRLELENDNLWAALAYAGTAPTPGRRSARPDSPGTSCWPSVCPRARRFLELRSSPPGGTPRWSCGSSSSPSSATSRPKSSTSTPRSRRASARSRSPRRRGREPLGLAQAALALAFAYAGDDDRARRWRDASATSSTRRETTGASRRAASSGRWSPRAPATSSTVAAMAAEAGRHSARSASTRFAFPALLLEAWVAERRRTARRGDEAYRRALELAARRRVRRPRGVRPGRARVDGARERRSAQAEELERRALAAAEAAHAAWAAAHARVELARSRCRTQAMPTAPSGCTATFSSGRSCAAAPGPREPLRRACRQPADGGAARPRRARRRPAATAAPAGAAPLLHCELAAAARLAAAGSNGRDARPVHEIEKGGLNDNGDQRAARRHAETHRAS